jgi:hypothetical protein
MPHPSTAALSLAALLAAAAAVPSACAPPPQPSTSCSACAAVARALSARLARTDAAPKNDLDWRGRVGPDGSRSGPRLAYADSEQRLTDLLDGLCTDGLAERSVWWNGPTGGGSAGQDGGGRWAAKGEALPDGWTVPASRAEREARAKELENFCGRLVEGVEDELPGALSAAAAKKSGGGGLSVGALLCERLTRHCPVGGSGSSAGRDDEL